MSTCTGGQSPQSCPTFTCPGCPRTFIYPARTPHTCPVCNGAGTVSRPPHVAGDQTMWAGDGGSFECRACSGSGLVWSE